MKPTATYTKDPKASLVYGWDWTNWIARAKGSNVTVVTSAWTVSDPALVTVGEGMTTTETWTQLSGGNLGDSYDVENVVDFSNCERDVMTLRIRISEH
jgi:hypothetical protein